MVSVKERLALLLSELLILGVVSGVCISEKVDNTSTSTKKFEGKTLVICSGAGLMKPMNELIGMFENETGAEVESTMVGAARFLGFCRPRAAATSLSPAPGTTPRSA
ncbi:hypothetical protein [Thermococcus piezophilus]|uniref:hypothetical protein n=1 Tax=Thermococcus piezophilus TaxID=1712654 RepID=UPI001F20ED12|nr:hypothetical protein [Thermococcus piezophilus]